MEPQYDVVPMFFLPEDFIDKKSDEDNAQYRRWSEQGVLTLTHGNVVDYEAVAAWLMAQAERYNMVECGIDRYKMTSITTILEREGFMPLVDVGMGFASQAAPVMEIKRAILNLGLRHGDNPLMRMCFANAVTVKDKAENEQFTKDKKRERGRIDGAVATSIAMACYLRHLDESEDWSIGIQTV